MPMRRTKRISSNLPADLLEDATRVTGKGITATLIDGLTLIRRTRAYHKARALHGKLRLEIDLDISRERRRR
jgi:hypothetical protein